MREHQLTDFACAKSAALDLHVGIAIDHLEQAARGDDTATNLSEAMYRVARHYRASPRISECQRDRLLHASNRAHLGALIHLSRWYSSRQIDVGMQALATQVMVWAESLEQRARRRSDFFVDLDAWARLLRNDLHNIALRLQIEERAAQRRAEQIKDLHREVAKMPGDE